MPARASAHAFPSLATAWVTGTDQLSCVERTAKACCPSPLPPSPSKVQYAGHCRATQSRRSSTKRCRASSRRHLTSASKIYVGSLYPATVFSRSFISTPSSSSLLRQVRGRLASLATSLAPVERVHEPRHTSPRSTNAGTSDLRRHIGPTNSSNCSSRSSVTTRTAKNCSSCRTRRRRQQSDRRQFPRPSPSIASTFFDAQRAILSCQIEGCE